MLVSCPMSRAVAQNIKIPVRRRFHLYSFLPYLIILLILKGPGMTLKNPKLFYENLNNLKSSLLNDVTKISQMELVQIQEVYKQKVRENVCLVTHLSILIHWFTSVMNAITVAMQIDV